MRALLISSLCNEGPHLLEWLAHHKRIGFTDFFITQNDSTDGTREILQLLHDMGEITYADNSEIFVDPSIRLKHQYQTNLKARETQAWKDADWAMMIDGDEFINLHAPHQNITDLTRALDADADAIICYWRHFGSSGQTDALNDLVTQSFTWCEDISAFNKTPRLFKTLYRPTRFSYGGIHFPHEPLGTIKTVDCSNQLAGNDPDTQNREIIPKTQIHATINHYRVMDAVRFISKHIREQLGKRPTKVAMWYWRPADINETQDFSLAHRAPETQAIMNDLNTKSNGALFELQSLSRQFHREQLAQALANDKDAKRVYKAVQKHMKETNAGRQH